MMHQEINEITLIDIQAELVRARTKFPNANANMMALVEEVGELAQALLQYTYEPAKGVKPSMIYKEAIQCAVMAIRVAEEGDRHFAYKGSIHATRHGIYNMPDADLKHHDVDL